MATSFDATNAPFDRLTPQQIGAVEAALDVGYFRPGETLIARDGAPDSLFVVIKGCVEERDGEEVVGLRGPGDCFDSRALVQGAAAHAFVAREETLCNLAPRDLMLKLISQNDRFAAFFYREISRKLEAAARDEEAARFSPLLGARVRDVPFHPAIFVAADETIASAGRKMEALKTNALFVRDGDRVGLLTGMGLARAAILDGRPVETGVADLAKYEIVTVEADDFVSRALLRMTKHNKRRVAVVDAGEYVGVLEDIDLLSFIAGNSQLVAARIDRASSLDDLAAAAGAIGSQVRMLRRQGVRVDVVAEIVSDLNRHLFAKLFAMTASA
jgi:CBS domain-containing protein